MKREDRQSQAEFIEALRECLGLGPLDQRRDRAATADAPQREFPLEVPEWRPE
ncbi:MAG TPA: hypothetical protein VNN80_03855 [Polyangiaceae bacterium]|nr:hypothetical protein [Polyangiaceae bacterium]HWP04470.1 hypothetical protein [Polyangiaceae bacterium]